MKLVKQMLFAVTIFLASCGLAPAAQAADFSASVGTDTNFVFRGQTMSERGLSSNLSIKEDIGGVYGKYDLHTVSFAGSKTNLLHIVEGGYETKICDVADVSAGYTYYAFTGGATNGVAASNPNFGEVFAQVYAYNISAKYAQRVTQPVGVIGKDDYFRLAYNTKFADKYSLGAGYEYQKSKVSGAVRNGYDATVGYSVTKDLTTFASYTLAGKGVNGVKLANQTDVGIKYAF